MEKENVRYLKKDKILKQLKKTLGIESFLRLVRYIKRKLRGYRPLDDDCYGVDANNYCYASIPIGNIDDIGFSDTEERQQKTFHDTDWKVVVKTPTKLNENLNYNHPQRCCSMSSMLSFNPITKEVKPFQPKTGLQNMLSWCRKAIIKSLTLKRLNMVEELAIPTRLKLIIGSLSLQDFLIDADKIPPESLDTEVYPALCLLTDSQVNLKLVASSSSVSRNDPKFLSTFEEGQQTIVIEELTKPLSDMIEDCKAKGTAIEEKLIWLILDKLVNHLIDTNISPLCHIASECVLFLSDKQILIQISSNDRANGHGMPEASNAVYEAPEVLNQNNPDSKALVWSTGCILYEMLALEPAYYDKDGTNPFQVYMKITNGEIPLIPSSGSEELKSLLRKCLVADPAARMPIQSLKDLISEHS